MTFDSVEEFEAYIKDLEKKIPGYMTEISKLMAEENLKTSSGSFMPTYGSAYDLMNLQKPAMATLQDGNDYVCSASGKDVLWLEYGTGVRYNPTEPHPNRPKEVSGIGEYGKGRGKRKRWYFTGDDDKTHSSSGIKATCSMNKGAKRAQERFEEFCKRVIKW